MLEAEEVDQDYFTPAASTSLANIFDNTSKPNNESGNSSLKYTAPKPQVPKSSQEENIGLIPIFRCLVDGHQWLNNIYSAKGKIGCSILKVTKDPQTDGALIMVLYDSNKHTLCSISLTHKLQVTVKQNGLLTFYESKEKIWSLYGSQDDVKKILEYSKSKNVQLIYPETQGTGPSGSDDKGNQEEVDSTDTDSEDLGTKTKASILSRMANMGKSVLPQIIASNEDNYSSSTSDEDKNSKQIILDKSLVKRNAAEPKPKKKAIITNPEKVPPANQTKPSIEESTKDNDDLLMMIQNTKTSSNSANSMDLFVTEQRINNSELRININRVNDKVDKLLSKLNDLGNKSTNDGNNINNELLQKLLKEYESKNKMYEELLRQKSNNPIGNEPDIPSTTNLLAIDCDNNQLNTKINELEVIMKQKDNEIIMLKDKVEKLRNDNELQSIQDNNKLYKKLSDIDNFSTKNNELLEKLLKQNEQFSSSNNDTLSNQIKAIMNDTFHGIVDNFDHNEKYSGEEIRSIVEKVIKRVTITSLKNLRAD